jgi:hypothetical protein
MATVRFSKDLIDQILSEAKKRMYPAVEKATTAHLDQAWGQRIYDKLFPVDVRNTISGLPDYWFTFTEKITIGRIGDLSCNMSFTLSSKCPWPTQFPNTDLAHKRYSFRDEIELKSHPEWEEFAKEVAAYYQRVREAHQKQSDYVAMVKKVIEAYSTLAPALKAWPPLWDLVPENYREKHREIKERNKNTVDLDVDLGKLTALTTAAKFGL